ncbi:MAG: septum formation protein Maf [Proteobacteria bacterium]|nr:septum formation protein Maf [Pseudomonadota bacterium]
MSRRLVLASTSPWRGELLARLGLPFEQLDSGLDEEPWKHRGLEARDLTLQLAEAKARALGITGDALVLGADQVVCVGDSILGKPGTPERAAEQLRLQSGGTPELITGLALLDCATGTVRTELDVSVLRFRVLTEGQIQRYVASEDVTGCAGSFRLEGLGISLFESISGRDYTGIIGLPLMAVTRMLADADLDPLGNS